MARPKGSGLIHHIEDHADAICEWLGRGETLAAYCRQEGAPSLFTVYSWRDSSAEFASRFARARDIGFDAIADSCLAIADDASGDVRVDEQGNVRQDSEFAARSRIRVETRLKLLAKWDPRRYGDKVVIGGDPEAPLRVLTTTERLHRIQAIVASVPVQHITVTPVDDVQELLS